MKIYDILRILNTYAVCVKALLQELLHKGLDCDSKIPEGMKTERDTRCSWFENLRKVKIHI